MASILDKLPRLRLPAVIAGAIGVGVGAALTALKLNPDLATLIGHAVASLLGG